MPSWFMFYLINVYCGRLSCKASNGQLYTLVIVNTDRASSQLNLPPTIIFRIINDETKQAKCSTISFSSDVKMGVAALSANHHHSFVSTSQSVSKCELSIYLTTLKSCQWPLNLPQLLWITSLITINCPNVHRLE